VALRSQRAYQGFAEVAGAAGDEEGGHVAPSNALSLKASNAVWAG
jgi:hypothetical protein